MNSKDGFRPQALAFALAPGLALALLSAPGGAQSRSSKILRRHAEPTQLVTLDLETGTLTRASAVQEKKLATCASFRNMDLGGFVGVDTGGSFCEWFDAGQSNGCGTDMMSSILFAYCSAALAVGSGGPGGSVRLGFYEGYTVGGGAPTTAVALFTLTGLPANTADSSFFGGVRCYFMRVAFNPLIHFAQGRLAYSWRFLDLGSGGLLAATFPFLACIQSCSANGPDGQGMVDLLDEYCPVGTFPPRDTFSFGSTIWQYFTSMSMRIESALPNPSLVAEFGGNSGCNKDGWVGAVKSAPPALAGSAPLAATLGQYWAPEVQLQKKGAHVPAGNHQDGAALVYRVSVPGAPNDGPCPAVPFAPYNRRVEIELAPGSLQVLSITGSVAGGVGAIAPQGVPEDIAFVCANWACYADFGPPVRDRSQLLYGTVGMQ